MTLTREPVPPTPRGSMTKARRERVLSRYGYRCSYPGCEITEGLEIDHTVPIALGGKDEDSWLVPLCSEHHRAKTRLDVKMIAKAKRLIRKQGPREPSRLRSRGFDKTKSKRMDGTVVERGTIPADRLSYPAQVEPVEVEV